MADQLTTAAPALPGEEVPRPELRDRLPVAARLCAVTAAYFVFAKLGLAFAGENANVTAIWPPTGIALAACLIWGLRMWPAVAAGALLANLTNDAPLGAAIGITLGSTLEALCGAALLSRASFNPSLARVADVVKLVVLGAVLSTLVGASIGVLSLSAFGALDGSGMLETWRTEWLGDMGGDLLVAPLLMIAASKPVLPRDRRELAEGLALLLGAVLVAAIAFRYDRPVAFAVMPLLIGTALRSRQIGAATAGLLISGFAIWYATKNVGLFAGGDVDTDLIRAQSFVAIAALSALLVAAMRSEHDLNVVALERLARSERKLAEAQRLAHIGSWEWDIATNEVSWSDELYRIFGLEREQFNASFEGYMERVHPDDRRTVQETINGALVDRTSFRFQHRVIRPGAEVRTLQCSGHVMFSANNEPQMMVGTAQDITERRVAEERLEHQALHDPLTGLPNRTQFMGRLGHALEDARGSGSALAVLFCDLDHFKRVNDTLGHEVGDALLEALTPRLRQALRPGDTVARFGGDEFVILCEDLAPNAPVAEVADRIAGVLSQPLLVGGREHLITVSIGVVIVEGGGADPTGVLRDADAAMYAAKEGGRGGVAIFDAGMRARLVERIGTESELRAALTNDELRVHFQPLVSLIDGSIVGAEALVRWQRPDGEMRPPNEFIGVAEDSGLIVPVGNWVMDEACRQWSQWRRELPGRAPITISVNVSPRQITDSDLASTVRSVLANSGIGPSQLDLEITESVFIHDPDATLAALNEVKELGVRLVLDDFGTGYSSLSYLKRFPIDVVKIDRSFVDGIGQQPEASAIVDAVLSMARAFDIDVVAEGVESEDQLRYLRDHGCAFAQGFFFSPPVEPDAMRALLDVERLPATAASTNGSPAPHSAPARA